MPSPRSHALLLWAVPVVIALTAAGCGGSSNTSNSTSAAGDPHGRRHEHPDSNIDHLDGRRRPHRHLVGSVQRGVLGHVRPRLETGRVHPERDDQALESGFH